MIQMRFILFLSSAVTLALSCAPGGVRAHGLSHTVSQGDAVVISLAYANGEEFSNQSYEIFRPGEERPFEVGRTDELGRVVFIPDRDGEWRVRAFSEDGHGLDIKVSATDGGPDVNFGGMPQHRSARIILGVSIIFAAFGFISLLYGRRRRRRSG
jgi:nickel transport protein